MNYVRRRVVARFYDYVQHSKTVQYSYYICRRSVWIHQVNRVNFRDAYCHDDSIIYYYYAQEVRIFWRTHNFGRWSIIHYHGNKSACWRLRAAWMRWTMICHHRDHRHLYRLRVDASKSTWLSDLSSELHQRMHLGILQKTYTIDPILLPTTLVVQAGQSAQCVTVCVPVCGR